MTTAGVRQWRECRRPLRSPRQMQRRIFERIRVILVRSAAETRAAWAQAALAVADGYVYVIACGSPGWPAMGCAGGRQQGLAGLVASSGSLGRVAGRVGGAGTCTVGGSGAGAAAGRVIGAVIASCAALANSTVVGIPIVGVFGHAGGDHLIEFAWALSGWVVDGRGGGVLRCAATCSSRSCPRQTAGCPVRHSYSTHANA